MENLFSGENARSHRVWAVMNRYDYYLECRKEHRNAMRRLEYWVDPLMIGVVVGLILVGLQAIIGIDWFQPWQIIIGTMVGITIIFVHEGSPRRTSLPYCRTDPDFWVVFPQNKKVSDLPETFLVFYLTSSNTLLRTRDHKLRIIVNSAVFD
jgi:hypothetical protein